MRSQLRHVLLKRQDTALAAVLTLAFVLRVWGIKFGLPYRYHIDEQFYVSWSLRLVNGEFNMPAITHGPNIYMFVLAVQDILVFLCLLATGQISSPSQFAHLYELDPTLVYLLARLLSAVTGTLTVLIIYHIGKDVWNKRVGLFAAIVLASSFLHVRQSHYAVPDVFMTFGVTLAMWAIVRAAVTESRRTYALAGLLAGIATAVKFTAGIVVLCLLLACFDSSISTRPLSRPMRRNLRKQLESVIVSGTAFGMGFLISYPVLLLSPRTFIEDLQIQSNWARNGFPPWQLDSLPAYLFYPQMLAWFVGIVPLAMGLIGIVHEAGWGSKQGRLLGVFLLAYYTALGMSKYYFVRFALPVVPFLALFAGASATWLIQHVPMKDRSGATSIWKRDVVWLAAAFAVMLPSLLNVVRHDWLLTRTDTRSLAKTWIEDNLPAGTRMAVDWPIHGPPLATPNESVPYARKVFNVTVVAGTGLSDHTLDWYREQDYDYLIASSFISSIPLLDEDRNADRRAFYAALDHELDLVQEFRPDAGDTELRFIFDEIYGPAIDLWQRKRPGPTIKVYKVR